MVSNSQAFNNSTTKVRAVGGYKAPEVLLALGLASFYLEGAVRKWYLESWSPWMEPVALTKVIFVCLAVLAIPRIDLGKELDRFRRAIVGFPLMLLLGGALLSASHAYHTVGAVMTLITVCDRALHRDLDSESSKLPGN